MKPSSDKDKLKSIRESIQVELDKLQDTYDWADKAAASSTNGADAIRRHYVHSGLLAMRRVAEEAGIALAPIVERKRPIFIPPSERVGLAAE